MVRSTPPKQPKAAAHSGSGVRVQQRFTCIILALIYCFSRPVFADALLRSQAVKASTIAQYYIDEQGVRVELEIGLEFIDGFKNLLPDAIYHEFGFGEKPLGERLENFFAQELVIAAGGEPLPARLTEIGPSHRRHHRERALTHSGFTRRHRLGAVKALNAAPPPLRIPLAPAGSPWQTGWSWIAPLSTS